MATSTAGTASRKRTDQRMLTRAEKNVAKKPGMTFTPEALARLQQLEQEAIIEANSNPDLKLQFAAVSDFLQQWALLKPEDQKKLGDQFQERANALVDIPFEQELTDLKSSLGSQLKTLNQKYQFLTEDEELKMSQNLDKLDNDTVRNLTDAFTSIEERGLGNSGMLRQAADAIMNGKATLVAQAQEAAALDKRQGMDVLRSGIEAANADAAIKERGIKQEQTVAREVKKNDLVTRSVQKDLLQQIISGAGELAPRDLTTYEPSALNPDSLPTPETTPTTTVANVPPAQRIRNVRLGISGDTAPTPAAPAASTIPAPVAPVNTPSKSTAGMTAEQRRNIRLRTAPTF